MGLELGGKSPVFVLGTDEGNIDEIALAAHHAVFWNAGQCCSAGSRTYVASHLFDAFLEKSIEIVQKVSLGDPRLESTSMGPVVNLSQQKSVNEFIEKARADPECRVVFEGSLPICNSLKNGSFVKPTIIVAPHNSFIAREEIFGPVMVIIRLAENISDEELIHLANDSLFGLAGAWFGNTARCLRLARQTESGIIWVNTYNILGPHIPFGGVKETGGSSDLGLQAIRNYTHVRMIVAKL